MINEKICLKRQSFDLLDFNDFNTILVGRSVYRLSKCAKENSRYILIFFRLVMYTKKKKHSHGDSITV